MSEIMKVTHQLFQDHTYHDITLTTIAEALGWSRGNLYKYVTTKEEIFLELFLEMQEKYFSAIKSDFSHKQNLSHEDFVEKWTRILDINRDYLKYFGILATIIETNVTVSRLAVFKKNVIADFDSIIQIIRNQCDNISYDDATDLYWALVFYGVGLNNSCYVSPLVRQAMEMAGLPMIEITFTDKFKKFMIMCIGKYCND